MSGRQDSSETVTLSTGHTVQLPLELEAQITGGVFSVPLVTVRGMLPDGLKPLRVTPRRGALTFLSVDYQRIGDDAMEPYNELSIQIPSAEENTFSIPVLSGLWNSTSGYVWDMPVTTEPAKALGEEIWGYPKRVADIAIDHGATKTRTVVSVDDETVLTMEIARPPTIPLQMPGYSYTKLDGALVRERTSIDGDVGGWPRTEKASIEFGEHQTAGQLSNMDLGSTAILRMAADCTFTIDSGEVRRY